MNHFEFLLASEVGVNGCIASGSCLLNVRLDLAEDGRYVALTRRSRFQSVDDPDQTV